MSSDDAGVGYTQGKDVKYVRSGQPTGWAAMAKEVRDFDEEKVKSCKEDIDTLMVFVRIMEGHDLNTRLLNTDFL